MKHDFTERGVTGMHMDMVIGRAGYLKGSFRDIKCSYAKTPHHGVTSYLGGGLDYEKVSRHNSRPIIRLSEFEV